MTPEGSRVACFSIQRHPGFRRLKALKCCRNKQCVWEWLPFSGASHRDSNSGHWNSDLGISNVWQSRISPMTTVGIQQCEDYLLQRHIHRSESFFPSKMIRKTNREKMGKWWCNQWDSWFPIIFRSQTQIKIQVLWVFHRELPMFASPACAGLGFLQLVEEVQGGGNPPGHQRIAH